jgi:hypothetical protein
LREERDLRDSEKQRGERVVITHEPRIFVVQRVVGHRRERPSTRSVDDARAAAEERGREHDYK